MVGTSWPSRSQSSSPSGTPSRPASAIRCITALVEPPMAALTRIAFSNASLVRIFVDRHVVLDQVDDAPAGQLRQHACGAKSTAGIAALPGMPMPSASTMRRHGGGRAHGHAVAGRARHAGLGVEEVLERHAPGLHVLAEAPDIGAGADLAGPL